MANIREQGHNYAHPNEPQHERAAPRRAAQSARPAAAHLDDIAECLFAIAFRFAADALGLARRDAIARIIWMCLKVSQGLAGLWHLVLVAHPDRPSIARRLGMRVDPLRDEPRGQTLSSRSIG